MDDYANLPRDRNNDYGGVHINSGIPNKAAFLIAEGGTHHGIAVNGIGRDDTARIYFRALTVYMNPYDNFVNARQAILQACSDIFGTTDGRYASIQNAFAAVGIGTPAP